MVKNYSMDMTYQNESYWKLPLNVRDAVDKAKLKNQKSEFYYKLKDLKRNIKKYQGLFKSKFQTHHIAFLKRKAAEIEVKLEKEKERYRKEVE